MVRTCIYVFESELYSPPPPLSFSIRTIFEFLNSSSKYATIYTDA